MVSKPLLLSGGLAILAAYTWQVFLHDFLFYAVGVGRQTSPIEAFPYDCRRLRHPLLESCEDLALDARGRRLFAACSDSLARGGWSPGGNKFNVSSRVLTDHVAVLNIDEEGEDGFYGLQKLQISGGYRGATGDGDRVIDVHGMKIEPLSTGGLRFLLVNHRPPTDEAGKPLDATKVGVNSTIEAFDLEDGSSSLEHVRTFHSAAILTPNAVAPTGDGGFLFTNDHGDAVAPTFLREFAFLFGPGSVGYCAADGKCKIAYPKGSFPNGIVKGHDGLYYVSESSSSRITVFSLQEDGALVKVDEILAGMGVDNLSVDENGDIYAAGFPSPMGLIKSLADPVNVSCPSTVLRFRRSVRANGTVEHEVVKVLDDSEATMLPCSTAAVHDSKTDTYFMGSVTSPFITVCKRRV